MDNTVVYVRVCFLVIGDIDTRQQTFGAEVLIEARWSKRKDFEPRLVITNLDRNQKERIWFTEETDEETKETLITMHWRLKGIFYENMELKYFPRDIQDISVCISVEGHANGVELVEDSTKMSSLSMCNFRDNQEWILFSHVEMESCPEHEESDVELGHCTGIVAKCRVVRQMRYFMMTSVLIMFAITLLPFTLFAFDPKWNTIRIMGTITLILAGTTYRNAVFHSLPLISYVTYMDLYFILSMVYLCSVCVVFAIISQYKEDLQRAKNIDSACFEALWVVVIFYHLFLAAVFFSKTNKKVEEMRVKDDLYKLRLTERQSLKKDLSPNVSIDSTPKPSIDSIPKQPIESTYLKEKP